MIVGTVQQSSSIMLFRSLGSENLDGGLPTHRSRPRSFDALRADER
jgi:hypothetical protein